MSGHVCFDADAFTGLHTLTFGPYCAFNRYRVAKWLHAKLKVLGHDKGWMGGWMHPDRGQNGGHAEKTPSTNAMDAMAAAFEAGVQRNKAQVKHGEKGTSKTPVKPGASKYVEDNGNGQPATVHWKSAAEAASKWEAGHVDVTFVNLLADPVILLHGSDAGWSKPAELPETGAVFPKQFFQAKSHEREIWSAEAQDGRQFGPWEIDISNGIVQDIVIEEIPQQGSPGSSSGGGGGGSSTAGEAGGGGSESASMTDAVSAAKDAAKGALKTNPCGSHIGCTDVLGDGVLARFLDFDGDKLLDLGITSAMDLLIFAHNGQGDGREHSYLDRSDYLTDFANPDGADALQTVLVQISNLLRHLDDNARTALLDVLAAKATTTLTEIVDKSDDAALVELPVSEWVAKKHIPAGAVHYFELLRIDSVAEVAALSDEVVSDIAGRLKFIEAWWFERAMAATKDAFKGKHDEL